MDVGSTCADLVMDDFICRDGVFPFRKFPVLRL